MMAQLKEKSDEKGEMRRKKKTKGSWKGLHSKNNTVLKRSIWLLLEL